MSDNLKLWKSVEKTNPAYTKGANVKGNKITSIAPQYQIMNVTEQFGIYGQAWGFKDIQLDYTLANDFGLVVFKAVFFFPGGEFPIINSISLFIDNARTKIDDNFAKKAETDALTKAISKLGFNADIFLGKFDDQRYVDEVKKEFGITSQSDGARKAFTSADAKHHIEKKTPLDVLLKSFDLTEDQQAKYLSLINK